MSARRVIWKYPLTMVTEQMLPVPEGTVFMSAGLQPVEFRRSMGVVVWAVVDPEEEHFEERRVIIRGTGHPWEVHYGTTRDDQADFLGTVQDHGTGLVWHVFAEQPSNYMTLPKLRSAARWR